MDKLFKLFPFIFAFACVLILCVWAFNIFIGVKIYKAVDENGLKSVIERVWDGPTK